ncbi:MAG: ferredoxin family protein [Armatimonadetes bacterium]|nr:ferredoxin family protein [Armatimonadota bacterium]
MKEPVVVAEKIDADEAERDLVEEIVTLASRHGHEVLVVPDLYHLPDESTVWDELRALPPVVTLWGWQHPRPLRWVLARQGVAADEWRLLDLRTLETPRGAYEPPPVQPERVGDVRRVTEPVLARWYPVLDHERCVSCGHCHDFCIFGVYERAEGEGVRVCLPDNCKPGCPACARVCPEGAIMFPLYDRDPAIAGAPGTLMTLDAAGRRLYYERTEQPCPTCSQLTDDDLAHVAADGACPECGRKLEQPSPVLAEIDDLIARLDRLSGGGPR